MLLYIEKNIKSNNKFYGMFRKEKSHMKKCDIIIPIYNSPEWVKMCIYALYKNTPEEYIGK